MTSGRPQTRARNALRRHFGDDAAAIFAALEVWCGVHSSVSAYVERELAEELELPDWVLPFVDVERIAELWIDEGRLWALQDRRTGGVHVFLAT